MSLFAVLAPCRKFNTCEKCTCAKTSNSPSNWNTWRASAWLERILNLWFPQFSSAKQIQWFGRFRHPQSDQRNTPSRQPSAGWHKLHHSWRTCHCQPSHRRCCTSSPLMSPTGEQEQHQLYQCQVLVRNVESTGWWRKLRLESVTENVENWYKIWLDKENIYHDWG